MAEQGQLRLVAPELGFGLSDVFNSRANDRKFERVLRHVNLGDGNVSSGLGQIDVLLTHCRDRSKCLSPVVLGLRVLGVGLGGLQVGASLGDFFLAAAIEKTFQNRLLGLHRGLGLRQLWQEATGIHAGEHLSPFNNGTFFNQNFGNSLISIKRYGCLTEVDVAIKG